MIKEGKTPQETQKKYKKITKILWILFAIPIILLIILFSLISFGLIGFMPSVEELANPKSVLATEVISSDGKLLGTYFQENRSNVKYKEISPNVINALVATEDIRFFDHSGIDYKSLGRVVFKTVIGQDQSSGGGSTITQQLAKMLFPRQKDQSKIELALRKFKEWVIAIKLEKYYTKEEILEMYLNKFDFLNLAVGIKTASQVYFNKQPIELNIQEAAMLVGMAKNPSLFNPIKREERTKERRNVVLHQMKTYKYITEQMYDSLKVLPLQLNYHKVDHKEGIAQYFREYLRMILTAKKPDIDNYFDKTQYREDSLEWENNSLYGWCNKNTKANGENYNIYTDGLKIYSTINYKMQTYAEQAVVEHIGGYLQAKFDKEQKDRKKAPFAWNVTDEQIEQIMKSAVRKSSRYADLKRAGKTEAQINNIFNKPIKMTVFSWRGEIDTVMTPLDSIKYYKHYLRASFMSVDPITGYTKAYVGGVNYTHFQYDMVKFGKRQVGSTFKPFIYVLAMQNGYSPCTKVPNIPVTFDMEEGQPPYTPQFSTAPWTEKTNGKMITLKYGLAHSLNQISAWVLKQYSPESAIKIANNMGVVSHIDPYPSICVGIPELTLYEMVGAYTSFADKGVYTQPIFVTRIEDKNGNILQKFKPRRNEAISEETAYLMLDLMRGVIQFGTSVRIRYKFKLSGDIAGKTGTTNNNSDGWFMGITPHLVSGAWVGGEERSIHFRSTDLGGGHSMALPIWAIYMNKVYADSTLGYSQKDIFERPKTLPIEIDCNKVNDENEEYDYGDI
jgi:penicillin-binding protein 1A